MSYLVLARKYRPQIFEDMIGQGHVVTTLTNAIRQGRIAHGFLFAGARGVGKTTGARLLAKALNCESGPTAEPCGTCRACVEITGGNSVDVQEIDGASNNGVDQVRELRENARYLPSRDRHKIYIIDEVHMLSGAAFNALLKTLEEPPAHVKFIFATTEPHRIPITILSRTQRFDFRRIPLGQIISRLERILEAEKISMGSSAVALIARQAEGSMRDALSLLDQVIGAGGEAIEDSLVEEILGVIDRQMVAALAGALIDGDGAAALEIVARVFDRGLDLARLAEDLAWHLRNLLVVQVGGRAETVLDVADHERVVLDEQANRASAATLTFLFDVVHSAVPEIGRAVQPRLVLEVALLKAVNMAPGIGLAELVDRVESLHAVVGGESPGPVSSGGGGRQGSGTVDDGKASVPSSSVFGKYAARMRAHAGQERKEEPQPVREATHKSTEAAVEERRGSRSTIGKAPREKSTSSRKANKSGEKGASGVPGESASPGGVELEKPTTRLPKADDSNASMADRYAALVEAVSGLPAMPFLGSALEHARPLSISDQEIALAVPRGFYHDLLNGTANRSVLESLMEDHFGKSLHLRMVAAEEAKLEGAPEAIATVKERRLNEEIESVRAEALASPAVRLALETLDGEIEDIRILDERLQDTRSSTTRAGVRAAGEEVAE